MSPILAIGAALVGTFAAKQALGTPSSAEISRARGASDVGSKVASPAAELRQDDLDAPEPRRLTPEESVRNFVF